MLCSYLNNVYSNLNNVKIVSGRGVFAEKEFEIGDFLLEYAGKHIFDDLPDTDYTYHSQYKGKHFWYVKTGLSQSYCILR